MMDLFNESRIKMNVINFSVFFVLILTLVLKMKF